MYLFALLTPTYCRVISGLPERIEDFTAASSDPAWAKFKRYSFMETDAGNIKVRVVHV